MHCSHVYISCAHACMICVVSPSCYLFVAWLDHVAEHTCGLYVAYERATCHTTSALRVQLMNDILCARTY